MGMGPEGARVDRSALVAVSLMIATICIISASVFANRVQLGAAVGFTLVAAATLVDKPVLPWSVLLSGLILVILFIPIKRYQMGGELPFDLEPYRLYTGFLVLAWLVALLVDGRARVRASGFEGPIALIGVGTLASDLVNADRIGALGIQADVIKGLIFLASFFLVLYMIVSLITTRASFDMLVMTLVGGGTVVAGFAVLEARTRYNVFEHLETLVPFLRYVNDVEFASLRGGELRVFASSQYPIALGAMFVMLVPLALYLALSGRHRWWLAVAALSVATLSTRSRTPVVMALVVVLVFLWLRPRAVRRLWPLLIPALVVAQFSLPGTIGTLRGAFFPEGGLIAEQSLDRGMYGGNRLADLDVAGEQFANRPLLGQGYSTRRVDTGDAESEILDNQWLKSLLETGVIGVLAWIWLFLLVILRLGRHARSHEDDSGWLATGIAASVTAFAVGMFFYDSFSFIQVTFVLFILIGLAAALLNGTLARDERTPAHSPY
jgi:O-antigen ligase